jgi:pectin methylesterase-like acyl-CoA thioesterase
MRKAKIGGRKDFHSAKPRRRGIRRRRRMNEIIYIVNFWLYSLVFHRPFCTQKKSNDSRRKSDRARPGIV